MNAENITLPAVSVSNDKTVTPHALSAKALLIRLSTSCYDGNLRDNVLTSEVKTNHNMSENRASVRKYVMKGPELKAVQAARQSVYELVESVSAPWLDGGIRIIPARTFVSAKVKIEEKIREFYAAVEKFLAAREDIIARDRVALNGTFRESDYLNPYALRARFAARIEAFPIPADFRVQGLDESLRAQLQADADRALLERMTDAKRDLCRRVIEKLEHLAARIDAAGKEGTKFYDSNLSNVTAACEQMKAANFDEDSQMDKVADSVSEAIAKLDAEGIKDNDAAREQAKALTEEKLAEMKDLMSGFVL